MRHPSAMRLPAGDRAYVDPVKVRDYLLSPTHERGWSKAQVFARFGFHRRTWPALLRLLESAAANGDAELASTTSFGQKYIVRSTLQSVGGRTASLVTIWIVLAAEDFPRLVTAYPEETAR